MNYLDHLTINQLNDFLKLKTITEQYLFLKKITFVSLVTYDSIKLNTWQDIEDFCRNFIKNGILLFWGDTHYSGHALPVINGKIIWLPFDKNTEISKYLTNLTVSCIKPKN
jgi:hypothetical protein